MGKIRVLLDTNVVLDFFTGRMNDGVAARIVQVGRSSPFEMCISFLTAINTMYVARKMNAAISPSDISSLFSILPQDGQQWTDAGTLDMPDFEDATQAACALRNQCFIVISRDRHFDRAPMSVIAPERFLSLVSGGE